MKKLPNVPIMLAIILILTMGSNCSEDENQINYETGFFPEEIYNLEGINSSYDDYNIALPQFTGELPIMFSSNRNSQGSDFDIVSGYLYFVFSQIDAEFTLNSEMLDEAFYNTLEDRVNTSGDELGPYRFFNGTNGQEYFFYSEEDAGGKLNIRYTSYSPVAANKSTPVKDTAPASALNSGSNDGYICFDSGISTLYLISDRYGDYDIMQADLGGVTDFDTWLEGEAVSLVKTDSINSDYNDKCPFIRQNLMIFASDRPGGLGGFDLYYSVYRNDKWSSPVNMGPDINTEYNEYRPVTGSYPNFSNNYILFSSDRPGGKGGYDLYFMGIDLSLYTDED